MAFDPDEEKIEAIEKQRLAKRKLTLELLQQRGASDNNRKTNVNKIRMGDRVSLTEEALQEHEELKGAVGTVVRIEAIREQGDELIEICWLLPTSFWSWEVCIAPQAHTQGALKMDPFCNELRAIAAEANALWIRLKAALPADVLPEECCCEMCLDINSADEQLEAVSIWLREAAEIREEHLAESN